MRVIFVSICVCMCALVCLCVCLCLCARVGQYYDIIIYCDIQRKILVLQDCQCDYHKVNCSETFTSVKCFHLIFTILVAIVLLSDIMIYHDNINDIIMIYQ